VICLLTRRAVAAEMAAVRLAAMICGLMAWSVGSASAQSLTGTTGLVSIPTAEMPADGAVAVGVSVVDERYNGHGFHRKFNGYAVTAQYVSVGFLPFAEVGLRLTRLVDYPEPQALGDRMVSLRVRLIEEGRLTPAVVVGAHDVIGTRIYHSMYVVGSKGLDSVPLLGGVSAHLGYGDGWPGLDAKGRQFQGVFGGVAVTPRPWVALLLEHDAERINGGVRLRPWRGLSLLAAAQGGNALSGSISYTHQLKP
jgi:hypothetical protein